MPKADPATALTWANSITSSTIRNQQTVQLVGKWADQNPDGRRARHARTCPHQPDRPDRTRRAAALRVVAANAPGK